MNILLDQLNEISESIIHMEEGDLLSISNVYSSIEENYIQLITLADNKSKPLVDQLLKLLNLALKNELSDFSLLVAHLSNAINLLQQLIDDPNTHLDKLINDIDFMLTGDDTILEIKTETEKTEVDFSDDIELYNSFVLEGLEHLDNVEANILILENDPLKQESVDIIFRAFHTIKGITGFLKLDDLNFLSHQLESVLEHVTQNNIVLGSDYLDLLLDYTDVIRKYINSIKLKLEGETDSLISIDRDEVSDRIQDLLSKPNIPRKKLGDILVETAGIEKEELDKLLEKESNKDKKLGEILINENKLNAKQVAHALRVQRESTIIGSSKSNAKKEKITDLSTVKVNASKLDSLLDMVGELAIAYNQVSLNSLNGQSKNGQFKQNVTQLDRIVSDLQKLSMTLRMTEIKQTFQKMNRLARDLSKKLNKPINLIISGEETEIDRNIVDKIYEPLVHLVRNTMDHGIESVDERIKTGKPETGTIHLSAYHEGGNVVIEIKDDGKGLDREKLLNKAIEKGIITDKESLTEQEANHLLFHSGLSTAEKLTDLSGRGLGMNIVKEDIDKLRGKVEVYSESGKGTTFILKIPLTMAIIDGLILAVGVNRYILPTIHVKQIFKMELNQYYTYKGEGEMIDMNGRLIPIIRLYDLFNASSKYTKPDEALMILVENDGKQKCFMLDDVLGKQEIVVKSLGDRLKDTEGFSAGTILGNGQVGLILDVKGIFHWQENLKTNDEPNEVIMESNQNES